VNREAWRDEGTRVLFNAGGAAHRRSTGTTHRWTVLRGDVFYPHVLHAHELSIPTYHGHLPHPLASL